MNFNFDLKGKSAYLIEVLLKTIDKLGISKTIEVLEVSHTYNDSEKRLIRTIVVTTCKHFDIDAIPKFYVLQANTILFPHTDQDTTCSINFLLSDGAAPVRFGENEYYYKTALLNTTRTHSVDKSPKDRILFKLSIKDEGFDIVKQKILNTISRS